MANLFFRYCFNVLCAIDRTIAALCGFSGRHLLSTELCHTEKYKFIRRMLDKRWPDHCRKAAFHEAAYCRLSDRQLGHK